VPLRDERRLTQFRTAAAFFAVAVLFERRRLTQMKPLTLALLAALAAAGILAGAPTDVSTKVETIGFCRLTADPQRYDNKTVRVRVSYVFDTTMTSDPFYFIYDPDCAGRERRASPEFETMNAEARARAFKLIETRASRNSAGTMARVELVLVGRFSSSKKGYGHLGQHPFGFDVTRVERVIPIPESAAWP
jgi:hypothetical protein